MSQCYSKKMVCSIWLPWEPGLGTRQLEFCDGYIALDCDLGARFLSLPHLC